MADPVRVFISYSRRDSALVKPVVDLLRSLPFPVFRDEDAIRPGERWEDRLIDELGAATHVLVFWCDHARDSDWVDLESDLAAEDASKVVVPVVLDDTPLPDELKSRQWVDLRVLAPVHLGPPVTRIQSGTTSYEESEELDGGDDGFPMEEELVDWEPELPPEAPPSPALFERSAEELARGFEDAVRA